MRVFLIWVLFGTPPVEDDFDIGDDCLRGFFEDDDGDGVVNAEDMCPNAPETINGFEDKDGCPDIAPRSLRAQILGTEIVLLDRVEFHPGSTVIRPESELVLHDVAVLLRVHPWIELVDVQGHTDDRGSESYNMRLSRLRAAAIVVRLTEFGIDLGRLSPRGLGEVQPRVPNISRATRRENRRVEFWIMREAKHHPPPTPDNPLL